jgi:hypothetical protein
MDAGQEDTIQAFDQQHYAIGQLVKWSMYGIFELHILRLGGFHSLSTFALSKLWSYGGLRDLINTSWISSKWSNVLHKCIQAAMCIIVKDRPVELFSYQHLFNCVTGINIRVNQQVAKPSLWKDVLICQWTLAKRILSKHLINNIMR